MTVDTLPSALDDASPIHYIEEAAEQSPEGLVFGDIINKFYNFEAGSHIAEKKPRGRPPKFKPAPPAGIIKNEISDEQDDELWVSDHDQRLLRMEFKQLTIEDGQTETVAMEELAALYNLSYRAVFEVVNG
jgi:hypothetical protein